MFKNKHHKVKVKTGMRVTNAPMAGVWGTVMEVIDRRKTARTLSERLKAKSSPFVYVIQWDNGLTETVRHKILWFDGDDPGFRRPVLHDPKNRDLGNNGEPSQPEDCDTDLG